MEKEKREMAAALLWAVWRSINSDYKSRYRRTIWEQFENTVRASAYTNNLGKFINRLSLKLNAPIKNEFTAEVEGIINSGDDKTLLKIIREETTLVVMMVRLKNEERLADYEAKMAEQATIEQMTNDEFFANVRKDTE